MRYTLRKRGPKKTSKYGGKRHYKNRGKKTIKRGGGLLSCLPPKFRAKYNFKDRDTKEEIKAKLKTMIISQDTPSNARDYMARSWARYTDHDSGDFKIKDKLSMEQRVNKQNARILSRKNSAAAYDPVAAREMSPEAFSASLAKALKGTSRTDASNFDEELDEYIAAVEEEDHRRAGKSASV